MVAQRAGIRREWCRIYEPMPAESD